MEPYRATDASSSSLGGRWNKDHKRSFLGVWNKTLGGVFFEACAPRNGYGLLARQLATDQVVRSAFS